MTAPMIPVRGWSYVRGNCDVCHHWTDSPGYRVVIAHEEATGAEERTRERCPWLSCPMACSRFVRPATDRA